jgi:hypothetical protein
MIKHDQNGCAGGCSTSFGAVSDVALGPWRCCAVCAPPRLEPSWSGLRRFAPLIGAVPLRPARIACCNSLGGYAELCSALTTAIRRITSSLPTSLRLPIELAKV